MENDPPKSRHFEGELPNVHKDGENVSTLLSPNTLMIFPQVYYLLGMR